MLVKNVQRSCATTGASGVGSDINWPCRVSWKQYSATVAAVLLINVAERQSIEKSTWLCGVSIVAAVAR